MRCLSRVVKRGHQDCSPRRRLSRLSYLLPLAGWFAFGGFAGGQAPRPTVPPTASKATTVAPPAPNVTTVENDVVETVVAEISPEVRDLLEEALRDYRRRDLKLALSRLRAAGEQYPELSPAEVVLARFYLADRLPGDAIQMLRNAAEALPDDPEAYLLLGEFAIAEGKLVEADSLIERGRLKVEAMPKEHPRRLGLMGTAMANMAAVAESRRNWESAEAHLDQWLKLFPKNPQAVLRLARVQFMSRQLDEARQSFDRLQELDATALPSAIQMGLLFDSTGQRELALAEFRAAASAHADVPEVRLAITQWALFAGMMPMAKENLEAARTAGGDPLVCQLLEGIYWRFQGEHEKAEILFRKVHDISPLNFDAINQLALVLVDQGDKALLGQALDYARLGVLLHADVRSETGRNAMSTFARVLYFGGDQAAARRAIDTVLSSGQLPPHAAFYAAEIYHEAGNAEVALKLVDAAVNSPRSFPEKSAAKQLLEELQADR
ncbi:MAG: tetratricopeptide repeat protein [Planctomycetaceae bacterium]|nr:MAG: tetratricopeptide repeat protein [Planctomycetaceae bacterium]